MAEDFAMEVLSGRWTPGRFKAGGLMAGPMMELTRI